MTTYGGDVWIVSGVDADLLDLRWQRFAAGLYEPLGVKVVDGCVVVTCKDRLVRLHDRDGNDEADFSESLSADEDVSVNFHAFNFDLQAGPDVTLFYAKSGHGADADLAGAIIAVAPDGHRGDCGPRGSGTIFVEMNTITLADGSGGNRRLRPPQILLLTLLVLPARLTAAPPAADRPNILMILTDDQGWGDVGAYGAEDLRTPAMDALVAAGMRFDNFYANCPVCSPTRAALLSGMVPDKVGVPGVIRTMPENNWGFLDPAAVLLPQPLKAAGYHTAIIGKWHLGLEAPSQPTDHGFDHFHGFLGDMMDDYWTHTRHGRHYMRLGEQDVRPEGHATDVFTKWAVDYIESRAKRDQPWFCYLAYNAPHFPVQPPAEWLARVKAREPGIDPTRAELVAFIEHLDAGIGRVIEALKQTGQADNTLIVFSSDNGGHEGSRANCGPHRGYKQQMFEGGIAVPCCAVWPGRIAAGSRSDLVALSSDLYPTFCEAAGAAVNHAIDGVSILPTLLGKPQTLDRTLVWVRREGGQRYQGQDYYAIRQGPWKLLQNDPFERYQLYHLGNDPLEQHDVAKQNRPVVNRLAALLRQHVQQAAAVPWQRPASAPSK